MLGGPSAEREVSLRTGAAVARALRSLRHAVTELDPKSGAGSWTLPTETDVVFLALHGTYGEDGTVQRELDALGVPYTGCDAEASWLAFDKLLTKQRCLADGVNTPRFVVLDSPASPFPDGWQFPVVLKPVRQGSSVGLQFVDRAEQWSGALAEALRHDTQVLCEERIVGRETTVGILDNQALPVVEVRPQSGAYDYQSKYTAGATEYFCPAEFAAATIVRIQQAGLAAFRAIGGRDYARVDVMVRADGTPFVLEVNTLPGMTETSLLPKAAAAAGLDYPALCQRMIELALRRPRMVH
ncbi:MAG: D-alanine--D-alanine ligase [Pedosphaera sp.]|nr:D-alanine--D-alanine ligase [Pedosphaera sp.]MST01335.1 D-alanine--D-alanine ligase [Pedosphaera sp.]